MSTSKVHRGKKGVHDGRQGDVYDPLCRWKNKQKQIEEEEEQRRQWNNENRKEVLSPAVFPWKGTSYTTQLVTIE